MEDMASGCDMLFSKRQDIKLVVDWGDAGPPREPPEGLHYGCLLRVSDSLSEALEQYTALAPSWTGCPGKRQAEGCGLCTVLHGKVVMPSAIDVAMAFQDTSVVLISPEVSDSA